MGNENGTWIMYGVEWDDPECLHTVDEAIEYIGEVGFLPLFRNEIPGFSLEERTVPEFWWSECFLSRTFPQKNRQNSLFSPREFPSFERD